MPSQRPLPTLDGQRSGYHDVAFLDNGACALHVDGTISCWEEASPPAGRFVSMVATEGGGSCGIRTDQTLVCWDGAAQPPQGPFASLYHGDTWCALDTAGAATCWSAPETDDGQTGGVIVEKPAGTWTQLAPPCGLRASGRIACWRDVPSDEYEYPSPSDLPAGRYAVITDDGSPAPCAIRRDGGLVCPGLEFMVAASGLTTTVPPPAGHFTAVAATGNFACAVRTSGALACWGYLERDRAGRPLVPSGRYLTVTRDSAEGLCAIRLDHALVCFGGYEAGRATSATGVGVDLLAAGEVDARATAVASGFDSGCVIHKGGTLACWGAVADGVPASGTFTSVEVNRMGERACAIKTGGHLLCWHPYEDPADFDGGVIPPGRYATPTGTFAAVALGDAADCAVRTDGRLVCWSPTFPPQAGPWAFEPPAGTFTSVDVGDDGACAIRTDGTLACWASLKAPAGTFKAVSVLSDHACGIRSDGAVECWGPADSLPYQPDGTFEAVDGDCGIRTDGTLACWGADFGSETPGSEPAPPNGTFVAIAGHCAVRTTGVLVCWDSDGVVAVPPTAAWLAPRSWVATGPVRLRWTGSGPVPVASYDVSLRHWTAVSARDTKVLTASRRTTLRLPVDPGRTVCPTVVARDLSAMVSEPASLDCITFPTDDRRFTIRSGTWTLLRDPGYYRGTALRTSTRGARLGMTVRVWRLALVASTCPGCGTVKVFGQRISLDGPRADRVVFDIDLCDGDEGCPDDPSQADLEIVVVSSGKPVIIDGIAASDGW